MSDELNDEATRAFNDWMKRGDRYENSEFQNLREAWRGGWAAKQARIEKFIAAVRKALIEVSK